MPKCRENWRRKRKLRRKNFDSWYANGWRHYVTRSLRESMLERFGMTSEQVHELGVRAMLNFMRRGDLDVSKAARSDQ